MDPTSDASDPQPSTTLPTTLTSPRSQRQRRQEAPDESSASNIDSRTPLRYGFPAPLRPLPLVNSPAPPNAEEAINWSSAREIILDILERHITNDFSVSLVNRLSPSVAKAASNPVSQNQNLTCLIITQHDEHSNSWYIALKELEEQFNVGSISGFTIEIMDPEMFKPQRPHFVEESVAITPLWPELRPKILNELSGLEWFTLSVVRFGRRLEALENPVTILIGAPPDSYETWDSLIDTIRDTVDGVLPGDPGEVEIAIIPANHPFPSLDEPSALLLPVSAFQSAVEMGSSFGPKGVDTSATVGGTIRLQDRQGNTREALVSVFHCFKPIVGREIEAQGLRPDSHSPCQSVSPSDPDRNKTLQWFKEEVDDWNERMRHTQEKFNMTGEPRYQDTINKRTRTIGRYQAEMKTIEEFDSRIGRLWACSGFQKEHLTDWSLSLLATNRSSKPNTLPPEEHSDLRGLTDRMYSPTHNEIKSHSTEGLKPGNLVWKKGRTTGITVGIINTFRTDIVLHDSQGQGLRFTGWEIIPTAEDTPFVKGGDSGAWVVDMKGNWTGMVFARLGSGSGAMHDVRTIIKDIERMTGCKVELP